MEVCRVHVAVDHDFVLRQGRKGGGKGCLPRAPFTLTMANCFIMLLFHEFCVNLYLWLPLLFSVSRGGVGEKGLIVLNGLVQCPLMARREQ